MIRIGLVGEAPHDTVSIKNLLEKEYSSIDFEFFEMQKNIRGSLLDHQKTKNGLRREFELEKPDFVIFIRDLDSLTDNRKQIALRKEYFRDVNRRVNKRGLFLLHVWEIEALILNDIDVFNKLYGTSLGPYANIMNIVEPKEELLKVHKYDPVDNSEIFSAMDFEKALKVFYFARFIRSLNKMIA